MEAVVVEIPALGKLTMLPEVEELQGSFLEAIYVVTLTILAVLVGDDSD